MQRRTLCCWINQEGWGCKEKAGSVGGAEEEYRGRVETEGFDARGKEYKAEGSGEWEQEEHKSDWGV